MKLKNYKIIKNRIKQIIGLSFNKEYIKTNKVYIFPLPKEEKINIHTLLMKYPIRIITLNKNHKVIENKILKQFKVYKPKYTFQYLLETRPENLKNIKTSEKIYWN